MAPRITEGAIMLLDGPFNKISEREVAPTVMHRFKQTAFRAKKFVFDEEASLTLGNFLGSAPDLLMENLQFAIPPFETTYVEFNFDEMLKGGKLPHTGADKKLGYLIDGDMVFCLVDSISKNDSVLISPLAYHLDGKLMPEETSLLPNLKNDPDHVDGWRLLAHYLGSTLQHLQSEEMRNKLVRIRSGYIYQHQLSSDDLARIVESTVGDLRNMWLMLLWLNQKTHLTFREVPFRRGISKGKLKTYSAYHVVKIDSTMHYRTIFKMKNEREAPRRHEVRGHFIHHHCDPHCSHVWPVMPNEKVQWVCEECGGIRSWRKEFLRGDATKGFIRKEYEVVK